MSRKSSLLRLQQILIRRRDALRRTLHGELERFNTMEQDVVGDIADQAVDTDYGAINSKLAEAESRELERIEYALQLARNQQYGVCESCDREIALTRLRALPYATMCIRCQKQAEQTASGEHRLRDHWMRFDEAHRLKTATSAIFTT